MKLVVNGIHFFLRGRFRQQGRLEALREYVQTGEEVRHRKLEGVLRQLTVRAGVAVASLG